MGFGVSSTKLRQQPILRLHSGQVWFGTIRAVLRYIYRPRAAYHLLAGKYSGILTYFQTKVNEKANNKITAEKAKDAEYISICIYTYGVHYVLRHRLTRIYPVRYRLRLSHRMNADFLASLVSSSSSALKASFRHRDWLSATGPF